MYLTQLVLILSSIRAIAVVILDCKRSFSSPEPLGQERTGSRDKNGKRSIFFSQNQFFKSVNCRREIFPRSAQASQTVRTSLHAFAGCFIVYHTIGDYLQKALLTFCFISKVTTFTKNASC